MKKIKRNDVVLIQRMYGRVWKRVTPDHFLVIDCGKMIHLVFEHDLVKEDYKGYYNMAGRFIRMPTLRQLKQMASYYNNVWADGREARFSRNR